MSTESIASSRSLRQFLAREAHEKETSTGQSPVLKAGSKIKTPTGAQKKMQKERRGNSQPNDHKKYKTTKTIKIKSKVDNVTKKTTGRVKRNAAKEREKGGKKRKKRLFCCEREKEKTLTNLTKTLEIFSDMETPESSKKAEYRCEIGGCGATYNSFTWYQKHVKKLHDQEVDRSSWEASVGASFISNLDDTFDPNEVTVTQASFVKGIGETSSQKVLNRPEAAATSSKGKIEVKAATKRKTTEESSGPMVQVEEKRVKEMKEVSKDSLDLSSKDSLELSTCQHSTIQDTPDPEVTQDTQPTSPSNSQQRRDDLIAQANSSGQSESLLALPGLVSTPVREEVLRSGEASDIFNTTDVGLLNPSDAIIKDLEDQLAKRTKSLNDALSQTDVLKTDNARLDREVEYLRNKLDEAEKEVNHKKSEMTKLENTLKKAVDEKKKGKNTNSDKDKDITALQAKLADMTAERDRLRGQAEANAKLSEIMERNLDEAHVKMDKMKKETICKDKSCESDKICGRSHILKKMKASQCRFYNIGMCKDSAEDCKYLHDAAAKLKFHEEKQRERKTFAEIRKEEKEKLKNSSQDQEDSEEVEKKENKKNEDKNNGLPAKKLSKVEKKKQKKQRQKMAKQEGKGNGNGKNKDKSMKKKKYEHHRGPGPATLHIYG